MGKIEDETDLPEDDLEWALDKCLELLKKWYPDYKEDDIIGQILDVYKICFE